MWTPLGLCVGWTSHFVASGMSLFCFSKFPTTAPSPRCDLQGPELLVSTAAVQMFLPDSSSHICQPCQRFCLFFTPEPYIIEFVYFSTFLICYKVSLLEHQVCSLGKTTAFFHEQEKSPALAQFAFTEEWASVPIDPCSLYHQNPRAKQVLHPPERAAPHLHLTAHHTGSPRCPHAQRMEHLCLNM